MDPMCRAIDLSRTGLRYGGPFGAVVTRGTEIIGEGFHTMSSRRDATAHAAINAIRDAGRFLKSPDLSACELHVSCALCPLCAAAAYYAGIRKVFYADSRKDGVACNPESMEFVQAREPERIAARRF